MLDHSPGWPAGVGEGVWCCSHMQAVPDFSAPIAQISTAPHLAQAGCPHTRGLEGVPAQHDCAVSCAAWHSSGHPWVCAELQWHATDQGCPVWRSGHAGPEHPHTARLVPSPDQAFSV